MKTTRDNTLVKAYKNLQVEIEFCLNKVAKEQKHADIHRLRLALKKEKALLHLADFISGNRVDSKEQLRIFSVLFSSLGEVRNAHITIKLISKYKKDFLNPFIENQNAIERECIGEMLEQIDWFRKQDFSEINENFLAKISVATSRTITLETSEYILSKIGEIGELTRNNNWRGNLHKIRKLIKRINFVVFLLSDKSESKEKLRPLLNNFKLLDRTIGIWHNYIEVVDSVRYFYLQKEFEEFEPEANKILNRLNNKIEELQYEIVGILKSQITQRKLKHLAETT